MKLYKEIIVWDGSDLEDDYEPATLSDLRAALAEHGMVTVPAELTAEDGFKAALSGEFFEKVLMNCGECEGDVYSEHDDVCPECDGAGEFSVGVPVSWTTIKQIHKAVVTAAQEQSDD